MTPSTPPSVFPATTRCRRTMRRIMTLALAATVATAAAAVATAVEASAATGTTYSFSEHDSSSDPTFNQLLGINDQQVIAGYFGSGGTDTPNKGYTIDPPYDQDNYNEENFPGSVQTQVTAINDFGNTAGFWANAQGANFGFVDQDGTFTTVTDPKTSSQPPVNQILGRNNANETVGFYNDAKGHSHAYEYNVVTKKFVAVTPPKAVSAMATGINDEGDIVGTLTTAKGATEGFLLKGITYTDFEIDGSTQTMALGVNDILQIVGSYTDSSGALHGFVQDSPGDVASVDDPDGIGSTVVNGINNGGTLVGFYTDEAGNTDGFVATPTTYAAG